MQPQAEYCIGCPRGRRGRIIARGDSETPGVASDCSGPWHIMRGALVTTIDGGREARLAADRQELCGREMRGQTVAADEGEQVIVSPAATGVDVLIIGGPEADAIAGNTPEENTALLNRAKDNVAQRAPYRASDPSGHMGSLVVIPGGADVAHVKRMVGDMVCDGFLGRLNQAADVVAQARVLAAEGFAGSDNPAALSALILLGQVELELASAAGHEQALRANGSAYIEELG